MEYEVGKAFEMINEKLDMILVKLYPEDVKNAKHVGDKNGIV